MESASPRFPHAHLHHDSHPPNPNPNRSDERKMSATCVESGVAPSTELGSDMLEEDTLGEGIDRESFGDVGTYGTTAAALEAELRATELELKVAKLLAQRARLQGKKQGCSSI